ncbi:MAG: Rieske (2Fe-2S) protein [Gemmatimonadota bacterium]
MKDVPTILASALPDDQARGVEADGREIVLCRVNGRITAFAGMCTHEELPLDGGEVRDGALTCAWHGARFDARTGRALALPAVQGLRTYETRVDDDGRVWVRIPD